ncbi:Ataxin-7-like protein 3, partial [Linnemannia zychae]
MDKTIASSKDGSDPSAASLASLSFEILGDLLDEIVLDVVSESHREIKNMRTICPICKTKCRNYVVRAGQDVFGQNPQPSNSQTYDCVHCQRSFPAQRYAPHLEKCLGLAGRSSSRAASRRMGAERAGSGSPFTPVSYSDDREASDSDKDLIEKKRKKNASSSNSQSNGNGASGANGGADYTVPNPTKSSSSKVKKQKPSKSGGTIKLKGLGVHTPSSTATPRDPTPIGEISLGFLDDNLLLANGRTLQNGSGGGSEASYGTAAVPTSSTTQKLSSSNPKRASQGSGVSSSKRPPGSSGSSGKNGQVLSFYDSLRAIGSPEGASSDDDNDDDYNFNNQNHGDDYDTPIINIHNKKKKNSENGRRKSNNKIKRKHSSDDEDDSDYIEDQGKGYENNKDYSMEIDEYSGYDGIGGMVGISSSSSSSSSKASSQRLPPLVLRLKKSSVHAGVSDPHDSEFI